MFSCVLLKYYTDFEFDRAIYSEFRLDFACTCTSMLVVNLYDIFIIAFVVNAFQNRFVLNFISLLLSLICGFVLIMMWL